MAVGKTGRRVGVGRVGVGGRPLFFNRARYRARARPRSVVPAGKRRKNAPLLLRDPPREPCRRIGVGACRRWGMTPSSIVLVIVLVLVLDP
jgi:hypothetical protein